MIGKESRSRQDPEIIKNYIFFKDELYRYNLLNTAKKIFKNASPELQKEINEKMLEKTIFRLIPHL